MRINGINKSLELSPELEFGGGLRNSIPEQFIARVPGTKDS